MFHRLKFITIVILEKKSSRFIYCVQFMTKWQDPNRTFFQLFQQDATLYNILYYWQFYTCFRRFLRPSSGAQNCTYSIWYMYSFELLMMGVETTWNMYSIDSNKEYCITLHLVGCTWKNTLTMHGPMNVKCKKNTL